MDIFLKYSQRGSVLSVAVLSVISIENIYQVVNRKYFLIEDEIFIPRRSLSSQFPNKVINVSSLVLLEGLFCLLRNVIHPFPLISPQVYNHQPMNVGTSASNIGHVICAFSWTKYVCHRLFDFVIRITLYYTLYFSLIMISGMFRIAGHSVINRTVLYF